MIIIQVKHNDIKRHTYITFIALDEIKGMALVTRRKNITFAL